MGQLFDTIRAPVAAGRHVVGQHAAERSEERGVLEWVDGAAGGTLIVERPNAQPNPSVEIEQVLADGFAGR